MLTLLLTAILIIYVALIAWLSYGFDKVNLFRLEFSPAKTSFSIIIPFRNEASHLQRLLTSLEHLNYPRSHFEIILVNDNSDDDSVTIITAFKKAQERQSHLDIKLINAVRVSHSPKKDAITTAISRAKFQWIVTTDADCILPKYWLDCFDEYIETHNCFAIAAPVEFTGKSSFFARFQILDTLSLQGATIGAFGINKPFMCNGANFAYSKEHFFKVNGFEGNGNIASGDDVFLLEKFIKLNASAVHLLKCKHAIVRTKVAASLSEYIQQRLRWASKASHYNTWFFKFVGIIVLLANAVVLGVIPLVLFGVLSFKTASLLVILKFSIDILLLFKTARFFNTEPLLLSYGLSSFLYPLVSVGIALMLPFKRYAWKGRRFKA